MTDVPADLPLEMPGEDPGPAPAPPMPMPIPSDAPQGVIDQGAGTDALKTDAQMGAVIDASEDEADEPLGHAELDAEAADVGGAGIALNSL